jgi:anti-sigma factor RsiW
MNGVTPPISEDDLHAYVDGQLEASRQPAVERYLEENPEAAHRVSAYQTQREAIRMAFKVDVAGTIPLQLTLTHIVARRNRNSRMLIAASVVLALGIGLGGGWLLHTPQDPGQAQQAMKRLEQEALTSHAVYSVDIRHPIEVPGTEEPHLRQWLSNRLNQTVVVPDLSALGYHLIGGRLLATEGGKAAALLMYDDTEHHRISLLLRPMAPALRVSEVLIGKDGVNGHAWIKNGLGVAVVASMPEDEISSLAARIGTDLGISG